jgi:hypothetical protein
MNALVRSDPSRLGAVITGSADNDSKAAVPTRAGHNWHSLSIGALQQISAHVLSVDCLGCFRRA